VLSESVSIPAISGAIAPDDATTATAATGAEEEAKRRADAYAVTADVGTGAVPKLKIEKMPSEH